MAPQQPRRVPLSVLIPTVVGAVVAPVVWFNWSSPWTSELVARMPAAVSGSSDTAALRSGGDAVDSSHFHWPSAGDLAGLWISSDEASRMLWAMKPGMIYLEYGSGGSTMAFAPMARRAYSVEHNEPWCKKMQQKLAAKGLTNRISYKCESVPAGTGGWGIANAFEEGDYKVFKRYVDTVTRLGEATFDVVLIDGRARVACALKVLPYLSSTSTIILHDARRAHYAAILDYYDEIGQVVGQRGARLFRRKASVVPLLPLSDEVIQGVYERK